jgi:hypothetical protein
MYNAVPEVASFFKQPFRFVVVDGQNAEVISDVFELWASGSLLGSGSEERLTLLG